MRQKRNLTARTNPDTTRLYRRMEPLFILALLVVLLAACSRSTPPGPNSIGGVVEQASYLLLDCSEGLRILIWDDIPHGGHGSNSVSSTTDSQFRQSGDAQSDDGRRYEYNFETSDCRQAEFAIDNIPYDLDQGKLFLIHTTGVATLVEQIDLDLSILSPTDAGIEDFGRQTDEIAAMIAGYGPVSLTASSTSMQELAPAVLDADLPPAAELDVSHEDKVLPPELDSLIAAVLSNDIKTRRELLRFTTAGCTTADGLGGPPKCEPDQAEGTPVEFLPVLGPGEGMALLPGEVDERLDFQTERLFAAYRRADTPIRDPNYSPGEYGLFFSTGETETYIQYVLVHADAEGHIIRLDYLACPLDEEGQIIEAEFLTCSPQQIIERDAGELLLPPLWEIEANSPGSVNTPPATIQSHPLAGLVYRTDEGLWIIDAGGEPTFVFDEPAARLSADGRYVIFQPEYDQDIWLADLTTGERRNLTGSSGRFNEAPQWWPGREDVIIFGSSEELGPGFGYPTTVRTNGSEYHILDQEAGGPLALSPDGQLLAYGSFDKAGKIYYLNGGTEAFDPADYGLAVEKIFQPAWSPDSKQLAWKVSGNRETNGWSNGVAVFDLESKTAKLFHTYSAVGGGTFPHYLSWSPSGDWLAFVTFNERAEDGRLPNLWIARPDGQDEMRLGTALDPIWSPDGNQLAYSVYDSSETANLVWIYETSSGESRQVLPPGTSIIDWLPPSTVIPAPLSDS